MRKQIISSFNCDYVTPFPNTPSGCQLLSMCTISYRVALSTQIRHYKASKEMLAKVLGMPQ